MQRKKKRTTETKTHIRMPVNRGGIRYDFSASECDDSFSGGVGIRGKEDWEGSGVPNPYDRRCVDMLGDDGRGTREVDRWTYGRLDA